MRLRSFHRASPFLLSLFAALTSDCTCDSSDVAKVQSGIVVEPGKLDLGEVPIGVRVQAVLTVKSTGEYVLTLEDIRLSGHPVFRIIGETERFLPPTSSDVILVEAKPGAIGEISTDLLIASDDPENFLIKIPIRMIGVPAPPCDDGNLCTIDAFDTTLNACAHTFNDGAACSPADKCIVEAVCSQGVCLGQPRICDDQSPCTRDVCRQTTGECIFLAEEEPCDDGNPCTADACVGNGCQHDMLPSGSPCDDGDLCTTADACFAGDCRGSGIADGSACDDGNSCTVEDSCRVGRCVGTSLITAKAEGEEVFSYPLSTWPRAFLHRREVSLSDDGVFYGLDHLPVTDPPGLTHVIFSMKQCGSEVFEFSYRPPDAHVLVRFVRREMQLTQEGVLRIVVGVRQLPDDGYRPESTTYVLDSAGNVLFSRVQTLGGETGRSLLPDGSHIFGVVWPLTDGPPTPEAPSIQNLVIVREDRAGNVLWRHERASFDWAEFLGVAGPRVLFWSSGRFGALDFNTGNTVWSSETLHITKEMALSTDLNLGVARATTQLIGVEILQGREIFVFPAVEDPAYLPRTDPVIAADGRVLVMMQRNDANFSAIGLDWVELASDGTLLSTTPLPYAFPTDVALTRHEDDPYPTVADDGIAYVGYGNRFWAIEPGGGIRWTLTSSVPNAFTGTVPLLRDDGVMLISEDHRRIKGVRTNGGRMSQSGWASFRHDGRRTNFTP